MKNSEVSRLWESGAPHDPRALALAQAIAKIDYENGDDRFCLRFGGDGDNGEELAYLLDIFFAQGGTIP